MIDLKSTQALSIHNRAAVAATAAASCFFCLRTFPSSSITDWTDHGTTALCPNCTVDAVLPGAYAMEDLSALCERYFADSPADPGDHDCVL